jgi:hypothetical protein
MILVDGGRAKQRQDLYRAAIFSWNYLMPRISRCEIYIELTKLKAVHGYCLEINDREYEIEIDRRLKGDDFLTTVFHEMIHVRQGVRKEHPDMGYTKYNNHDEYLKQPWEVEAYELQEIMLKEWNRRNMRCPRLIS